MTLILCRNLRKIVGVMRVLILFTVPGLCVLPGVCNFDIDPKVQRDCVPAGGGGPQYDAAGAARGIAARHTHKDCASNHAQLQTGLGLQLPTRHSVNVAAKPIANCRVASTNTTDTDDTNYTNTAAAIAAANAECVLPHR